MPNYRVIAQNGLNIRSGPGTEFEDLGDLLYGDEVISPDTSKFVPILLEDSSIGWVDLGFLEELSGLQAPSAKPEEGHETSPPAPGAMKTSPRGLEFIKAEEGCVLHVYQDPAGYSTIGVGHLLKGEKFGEITAEEALQLLAHDMEVAENAINQLVTVPLSQNQFDALASFIFNVGTGAFQKSTLLRLLNQGQYEAVPGQLAQWRKAGGRVLPGLVQRRQREGELWAAGAPNSQAATAVPSPGGVPIQRVLDAAFSLSHTDYRMGAEIKKGADPRSIKFTDCSETIEFACGIAGVIPSMPDGAMYQFAHCYRHHTVIMVAQALEIPGALLFKFSEDPLQCARENRRPSTAHVAFSLDGGETFEARSTGSGVGYFDDAREQNWTHAALIPGVDYAGNAA